MKLSRVLLPLTLSIIAAVAFSAHSTSAQGAGVYTAAQASAGAAIYTAQCSQCHGVKLEGGAGPSLAGQLEAG